MLDSGPLKGRQSLAHRWGGLPLYGVVLLQGMPLGRELSPLRSGLNDAQQQLMERVSTVGVTQSLLPALVWTALYLFAALVLARNSASPNLRTMLARQWPLPLLVVISLLSLVWTPNSGKVLASSFHAAGITLVAMAAAIRCVNEMPSFFRALAICIALNLSAHLACVVVSPEIGIAADGRWMGMATHSNSLGGFAMVGLWASCLAVLWNHGRPRRLPFVCAIVAVVVLAGSGSTTSMLAAAVAVGMTLLVQISSRWTKPLRQLANVAFACVLVVTVVVITVFGSVLGRLTATLGKSDDFTGRNVIWQEALRLIREHPVFGWGFDDNARVIVETGFIHSGYHNGYLDLAVRGGILALAVAVFAILRWVATVGRAGRIWQQASIPIVVAVLIHNFMEVSLFSPRSLIWSVLSVVLFATSLVAANVHRRVQIDGVRIPSDGFAGR